MRERPLSRMICRTSACVASDGTATRSDTCVMTSRTVVSPNSNTLSIHSPSTSSMVPRSSPRSTIMRISSSVTASSSPSVFMCSSFSTEFVEKDRNHTTGRITVAIAETTPQDSRATCMGRCMAMRLGTSSPNTNVK